MPPSAKSANGSRAPNRRAGTPSTRSRAPPGVETVSRIINDSPLVREETREKVKALMPSSLSPDPMARALASGVFPIGKVYDNRTPNTSSTCSGCRQPARPGFELVVHPATARRRLHRRRASVRAAEIAWRPRCPGFPRPALGHANEIGCRYAASPCSAWTTGG
jgi:hypothetical protein